MTQCGSIKYFTRTLHGTHSEGIGAWRYDWNQFCISAAVSGLFSGTTLPLFFALSVSSRSRSAEFGRTIVYAKLNASEKFNKSRRRDERAILSEMHMWKSEAHARDRFVLIVVVVSLLDLIFRTGSLVLTITFCFTFRLVYASNDESQSAMRRGCDARTLTHTHTYTHTHTHSHTQLARTRGSKFIFSQLSFTRRRWDALIN